MNRIQEEREYWDKNSKDPDVLNKYISNIDFILPELKGKTLEIGCGIGRLMYPGYYGIDISEGMLNIAKITHPSCEFILTDGRHIPYDDCFFDNVYCVLLFQHLPLEGVSSYISEANRVLKKGGEFIFQYIPGDENEPFSHHYSRETIYSLLNGFCFSTKSKNIHPSWEWVYAIKN